jgi:hypothetical protein
MNRFVCSAVSWLRGVTGDDAYDKYLAHHERNHPDAQPSGRAADDARGVLQLSARAEMERDQPLLLTATCIEPMHSMRAVITSPGTIGAMPSGVPVRITSPGCSV